MTHACIVSGSCGRAGALATPGRRSSVGGLVLAAIVGASPGLPAPASAQAPLPERSTTTLARAAAARSTARHAARFDAIFAKYSKRYFGVGFDWRRFKAQAMAESNLDSTATSVVGARGLMQLMPSTFAAIQSRRPDFGEIDDPEWNVAAGIMHDRYLWKLWAPVVPDTDRFAFMFGSYNAGEGPIRRASAAASARRLEPDRWTSIEAVAPAVPRWRYRETLGYVRRIDANFRRLTRQE